MSKSKVVRNTLMGSAAAVALLGAVTTAQAVETKFGDVQIIFDTTVSVGASMRTANRETQFLNEGNGGPIDPRESGPAIPGFSNVAVNSFSLNPGRLNYTPNQDNFDGSLNADDGRLNFNSGDLIGANVKASHDLQVSWQNYKVFVRAIGFYDVIMNDRGVGERSELIDQALGDVGRNYELLDAFISADYTIAEMPLNLRLGKQVINWGESTFILGGNNVFNPIDVGAFRRPGSEIKEALVPVNAVYGSLSLPFDVSIAGYYALDWEPFELDPSGTPFSGVDIVALGSGVGGNEGRGSFLTGSPFAGQRRNCTAPAGSGTRTVQTNGLLPDPLALGAAVGNNKLECSDSQFVNYKTPYTVGQHESVRLGLARTLAGDGVTQITQAYLQRGNDVFADDSGQYGLSLRYYADWLGGTEFGAYYQNYHSRLPILSERRVSGTGEFSYFNLGDNAQLSQIGSRSLHAAGCGFSTPANIGAIQILPGDTPVQIATKRFTAGAIAQGTINAVVPASERTAMQNTRFADAGGVLATAAPVLAAHGITLFNNPDPTIGINNQYNLMVSNCILAYYQSGAVAVPGGSSVQTFNGAEFYNASGRLDTFFTYPEDIEAYGFSFNTTLWGWGIQGDFTYRPNAPFQVDTDSVTIAALVNGCIFNTLFGLAGSQILNPLANPDGTGVKPRCGGPNELNGVMRNEMVTAQIGTTATFSASDWWVDALGADLAVVVTEVGMAFVPDVEETWIDKLPSRPTFPAPPVAGVIYKDMVTQYQNIGCQGTDLPAGGFLSLDPKTSKQCRPNDLSAGLVFLARFDYNNAFNSGWVITPQIVYAYDFEGTTPSPYGNYLEDRQSVGLSVTGTLNNNLRVGASYSNFFGGHVSNKAKDQDFASVTASYTF